MVTHRLEKKREGKERKRDRSFFYLFRKRKENSVVNPRKKLFTDSFVMLDQQSVSFSFLFFLDFVCLAIPILKLS